LRLLSLNPITVIEEVIHLVLKILPFPKAAPARKIRRVIVHLLRQLQQDRLGNSLMAANAMVRPGAET